MGMTISTIYCHHGTGRVVWTSTTFSSSGSTSRPASLVLLPGTKTKTGVPLPFHTLVPGRLLVVVQ